MQFSSSIHALVAGLLITSVVADPVQGLLPRATTDHSSACSSSYSVLTSGRPTPTDKSLSSFFAAQPQTTFTVPSALGPAYCTYDASSVNWLRSTVAPFVSQCSDWLKPSVASSLSAEAKDHSTTATWCYSATHNVAPARETGFMAPGVMAAAGLVAAML